jgi:hypothetical protein
MKKFISMLVVGFLLVATAHSQEKKQWKELHDFHAVMSSTFHPAEDGDLKPIRNRSQEMVEKAEAWKASEAPEGYNKEAVKGTLDKLVEGSKELNKLVKENAEDKVLTDKLSKLHDVFHEIMEKCRK